MKQSFDERVGGFAIRGPRGVIVVVVLVVVAFALGQLLSGGGEEIPRETTHDHAQESLQPTLWTCSMHPQIKLPEPGKCPICAMDLIPLETGASEEAGPRQLRMSESARQLARIRTSPAERRFAEAEVRMYGRIAYDESRLAYITAWVPGRLDRLYADYTGVTVKKGDHLVYMYSPELLSTQEELIQALAAVEALGKSASVVLRSTAGATLKATREKLRLYGLTAAQIRRVEETRTATDHLTIYAPTGGVVVHKNALEGMYVETGTQIYTIASLDKLWVLFEAYESDLPWIHYGQRVGFSSQSFPGQTFDAVISFVDPLVDPKTRTVRVRAVVDNSSGRLKPDMLVRGVLRSQIDAGGHIIDVELAGKWICPMHPDVVQEGPGDCGQCGMDLVPAASLGYVPEKSAGGEPPVLIPASAPLITGKRAVVYVEVGDDQGPVYEGREVELGPRAGDYYVVRSGIEEGDLVVTNGAFKIDSELQIRARPSMMSPEGGAAPGHRHGNGRQVPAGGTPVKSDSGGDEAVVAPESESPLVRAALADVYQAYFGVQMALAKDDLESARSFAVELAGAVGGVDMSLLTTQGRARWIDLSTTIEKQAKRIADHDDIKVARDAFYTLSQAAVGIERSFGHSGQQSHYLKFCPMARDGDGAYWLQSVEVTWNSYYGDRMPRCGSTKDTFAPVGLEGEPSHGAH